VDADLQPLRGPTSSDQRRERHVLPPGRQHPPPHLADADPHGLVDEGSDGGCR
jgi:hypothetical protein